MRKFICFFFLGFFILGICTAQEQENTWNGTVRFDIADNFLNLHNAVPGMSVTWTHFINARLGIPLQIDTHFGRGLLPGFQISFLSGAEFIPISPAYKDKSGLLLNVKAGISLLIYEGVRPAFITKANVGYQFISTRGFVFTPAAGIIYNVHSGLGFNLLLDLGFAYRRELFRGLFN